LNILLDANGDWAVDNGAVQFASGKQEIAQSIATRLRTILGEWFLNTELGLPWFSRILRKNPNSAEVENIFVKAIADSPGVTSIDEFKMSYIKETRKLLVEARINSVDGVISFTEEVP